MPCRHAVRWVTPPCAAFILLAATVPRPAIGLKTSQTPDLAPARTRDSNVTSPIEDTPGQEAVACRTPPGPLEYDYGIFRSAYKGDPLNISNTGFDMNGELHGDYRPLVQMMRKLAAGGSALILVFGGSETAGHGCVQDVVAGCRRHKPCTVLREGDCAWPERLKHWLQLAYPQGQVDVRNLARGGTTTFDLLAGIGMLLRTRDTTDPDLVIIDTLVNDAFGAGQVSYGLDSGLSSLLVPPQAAVSVAYEKLVRTVNELCPRAGVVSFLAGCQLCRAKAVEHLKVAEHYDLPLIDWGEYVDRNPHMWEGGHDKHPVFYVHQAIADVFAALMGKAWRKFCPSQSNANDASYTGISHVASLWPREALEAFATCTHPLSVYDAYDKDTAQPTVGPDSDWQLAEDVAGKPGWISNKPNASVTFATKFGRFPRLVITWLRGYEKLGRAQMLIKERAFFLNGLWDDVASHAKVTQSYTLWFNAGLGYGRGMDKAAGGELGFDVKPFSNQQVTIVNQELEQPEMLTKMKIIQLLTC